MAKVNFRKELRHLYRPSATEVTMVDVPPMNFVMIDGSGDPNMSQMYEDAIETLYAVSYSIKFVGKRGEGGVDYVVMPLEGLWWTDDMSQFSLDNKDIWKWTAMIMQPDHVTEDIFKQAVERIREKKNPAALDKLRLERYHEGLAAQIMYLGPYDQEGPTIERLHTWIIDNGYDYRGAKKHHEIYLSDPRRVAPEKLRTVIRQPMLKKSG